MIIEKHLMKETVHAVDMSDRLNAEGKYLVKVRGMEFCNGESVVKDCILDLSELDIDQIGVIAGFLDAVFDGCGLDHISGVSIVKPQEIVKGETNE